MKSHLPMLHLTVNPNSLINRPPSSPSSHCQPPPWPGPGSSLFPKGRVARCTSTAPDSAPRVGCTSTARFTPRVVERKALALRGALHSQVASASTGLALAHWTGAQVAQKPGSLGWTCHTPTCCWSEVRISSNAARDTSGPQHS